EDGIRDFHVTGVQTCALPILPSGTAQPPPVAMGNRRSTSPRPILLIPQMLTLTIALDFVSRACGATATSMWGSSGRVAFDAVVEAIIPQLAIERRAPDPQRSRHPRHA